MKKYLPAIGVVLLFIASSAISQNYTGEINNLISQKSQTGAFIYFLTIVAATVLAPLTSLPLIPFATKAWGVAWTVILNVLGWTIGAAIAFWIARQFGSPIVEKFVSLREIEKRYRNIPEKNLFWYLLALRMTTPVDIMSYALGLFTKISWKMYISTTFLGIIPFTFFFVYFGTIPFIWQIIIFSIVLSLLGLVFFSSKR